MELSMLYPVLVICAFVVVYFLFVLRRKQKPKVQMIDPNSIQRGRIIHSVLPDEMMVRLRKLHEVFSEVDGTSFEQWVDDFKRDADPVSNIVIWEHMARAYLWFLEGGPEADLELKKEIFQTVLVRSMMSSDDALSQIRLNRLMKSDAESIMALYELEPMPIKVVASN